MNNSEFNLDLPEIMKVIQNVLKYISIGIFVYCLIGLSNSLKRNYPLWANPMYAAGTIVDYREVSWVTMTEGSSIQTTTKLPVVEFHNAGNTKIKFTDSVGHNYTVTGSVPVIYSSADSSNARIDKGLLNWIDTYIWLFGFIGGLLGMRRFTKANNEMASKQLKDRLSKNDSHIA